MSKKVKRLLLVVVVLCVLTALYFILTKTVLKPDDEENKNEQKDNIAVSQVGAENIRSFSYCCADTNNEFLTLIKDKGDVWHYEKDESFPLNQKYVTVMAKGLGSIKAERVILKEEAGDLSEYGFDNPTISIRFTENDGTETACYIGNENASTENFYFRIEGDSNIYQINADLKVNFTMGLYDLFDMEDYPLVETSSFRHVEIQNGDQTMHLKGVIEEDAEEHISINSSYMEKDTSWYVGVGNEDYKLGNQITIKALIEELSKFAFYRAVDYNVDENKYAKYGLDQPKAVIKVDYQVLDETTARTVEVAEGISEIQCDPIDKQYTLYVGNASNDTNYADDYYVRLEGSTKIYTIESSALERFLQLDSSTYCVK